MAYTYEYFKKSADFILEKAGFEPEIALVLGTALGPLGDEIEDPVVIDYKDIPNFLISTVNSHAGKLILGTLCGKKVVCMSGRFHYYEGYDFEQLVIPVRVFKLLGVKNLILTNAAGAVNTDYSPGEVMLIKDHIKLMGASPMRGPNVDEFGKRFFDVSDMYSKALRQIAKDCIEKTDLKVHEGTYFYWMGPQFESPAEIRAIRVLGGDAVGMSTVTEALTAAHCGLPVLALSLITNMAAGVLEQPIDGKEVDSVARAASAQLRGYIKHIISKI